MNTSAYHMFICIPRTFLFHIPMDTLYSVVFLLLRLKFTPYLDWLPGLLLWPHHRDLRGNGRLERVLRRLRRPPHAPRRAFRQVERRRRHLLRNPWWGQFSGVFWVNIGSNFWSQANVEGLLKYTTNRTTTARCLDNLTVFGGDIRVDLNAK